MQEIKLFENRTGLSVPTTDIINNIKDLVFNGEISPLETGIMLKKIEKISKDIFKDENFKDYIRDETTKCFDGKSYKGFGMTISERAVSTYYDFQVCGDPVWNALAQIQEEIKTLIKDREEELKSFIPKEGKIQFGIANNDKVQTIPMLPKLEWEACGEEVTIKPPIKGQKMGLVYKEDKE